MVHPDKKSNHSRRYFLSGPRLEFMLSEVGALQSSCFPAPFPIRKKQKGFPLQTEDARFNDSIEKIKDYELIACPKCVYFKT